ncbi:DinB/UmuC family translesion DNA polymerase [Nonomuraea cavernae]|uniref:DinB/UmuC family translesion DNA polymerase n=1 Tax=Nonomuraea cavernae TaxID=2045107 RepID=UPI0033E3EA77
MKNVHYLALGKGEAEIVTTPWMPRGHSRETTFAADLTDDTEIAAQVAALAGQVAADAAAGNRVIVRVSVKVRFAPFVTRTRQSKLSMPTTDPAALTRAALAVLGRFDLDRPVRLLGVAVDYEMPGRTRTARP